VKAPGISDRRREILEDLAVLTGSQVVGEDLGIELGKVILAEPGRAKRVLILDRRENTRGQNDEECHR